MAERNGLQRGQRLLACQGVSLTSPAAFNAWEENTHGLERVTLDAEWRGQRLQFTLASGKTGVTVRPELPPALLAEYEQAGEALRAKQHAEAARTWRDIAPDVPEASARAWLYWKAGQAAGAAHDWESAHSSYVRACELLQGSGDTAAQASVWADLGKCCLSRSDLETAQHWHEQARRADEAAGRHLWAARDINDLGRLAWKRGDLAAARGYFLNALSLWDSLTPDSLDVATGLSNLGLVSLSQGDLERASEQHSHALAIRERLAPGSVDEAKSLNNLGLVLSKRGDLAWAQDYFARASDLWERLAPDSLDTATGLGNLGMIAYQRGHLEVSLGYSARALAIRERLEPHSQETAAALSNIGVVFWERQDLPAAEAHFARALHIWRRLSTRSLNVAAAMTNLGAVALKRDDLTTAQSHFEDARGILTGLAPDSLENADVSEDIGWIALRQDCMPEAVEHFHQAIVIVERQRTQIATPEGRALLLAGHMRKYAGLLHAYLGVGDTESAFYTLERARARSFTEMLADRAVDTSDAPPELLAEQQEIDWQRGQTYNELSQSTGADQGAQAVETLHRTLRELERRQENLVAKIRAASPRYAALQYPQPLTLDAAQAMLEPGTLLLSYLVDDDQTFLFAVTATHARTHILPLGRKALQEQVRSFRQAIDTTRLTHDPAQEAALARTLYAALIQPAQSAVRRAERLLFCPDGPLHTLPFAALVTNGQGKPRYLGAEKPLHSVLSMTTHAQTRAARPQPRPATPPRLLAFGDPLYGASEKNGPTPGGGELSLLQTRGLSLAPLPHSRAEVEGLAGLFGDGAVVRLGAEATKDAVLREGGDADLLHFACHGWFDPHLPLSSGLALSRPETQGQETAGDSGLLQAWEILQKLRLSADLVVLSSCQSGLGQEVRGEGLVGLTRAFQYAGARSLVVTLWDVDDAGTAAFMQTFYTHVKAGAGKDDALRRGGLALQADPRWSSPRHWAAFVLIGDRQ